MEAATAASGAERSITQHPDPELELFPPSQRGSGGMTANAPRIALPCQAIRRSMSMAIMILVWQVGRIRSPGWRKQLNWLHEVSALLSRLTEEHGGAEESAIGEIAKRCGSFCDEIASRQDIEPKG